jgi:hypothetical protein
MIIFIVIEAETPWKFRAGAVTDKVHCSQLMFAIGCLPHLLSADWARRGELYQFDLSGPPGGAGQMRPPGSDCLEAIA